MVNLESLKPQYITNDIGEKTAVIIPMAEFQTLLEDIEDLAAVAERSDEGTIDHVELVAELKQNGIL